jgi:predicted TIM-barrel fold metal-dependent hydrolase
VGDKTPQMSHLLNLFDDWIGHDPRLRRAILSDNPARLFGF